MVRHVVLLTTLVALSACSSSEESSSTTTAAPATTTATTPPTTLPPTTATPTTAAPTTTAPPTTAAPATAAPTTAASTTVTPTTVAPAGTEINDGFGTYDVGVTTVTVADTTGRDRPLTVDVWFPISEPQPQPHHYELIPGTYYESARASTATAGHLAPDGPFPLVVYSHGSGGLRYIHSDYTEAIASHGYIVIAPDHTGNTAVDQLGGTEDETNQIALDRPTDITALLDAALDPTRELGTFTPAIDPERIAVTGHSFGGFTSMAVAGGFSNDLGAYGADERVDAIIPLAPASLQTDAELTAVDVPMLIMVGTNDATTPADPHVDRPWALSTGAPAYRVDLEAAEHMSFTMVCDYLVQLPDRDAPEVVVDTLNGYASAGCEDGDMPIDRVDSVTNSLAAAFLDEVFRDGPPITPLPDETDLTIQTR